MTDAIWDRFCRIPESANYRLTAVLRHLAKRGEEDLPPRAFRWVGRASPASPKLVEIEGHGVVLTGHASPIEDRQQLFVTDIIVDETEEPIRKPRRRKLADTRQGAFKFPNHKGHSSSEGEPK